MPTVQATVRWLTVLDVRPVRFLLVGVTGVGVNTLVVWASTAGLYLQTTLAGVLAAALSTFTNFILNNFFTWSDRRSSDLRVVAGRLVRYYVTTGGGNLIYLAVLTVLVEVLGTRLFLANLVAIGTGGVFNYWVHNVWTWGKRRRR
ncbi:MAG: GtrA family protein [Armatimonadota bacterium]|nr:GtrA family protein [Armatimonadota bacterium]MDR7427665.1 GtrA family protein [Armatimonadota bacterium]MDR7463723.1 GtrA family protein [Armatimonadota bacterium]MDR7470184.1 GtrA family protein [Armatimonadota bacterium]MDR7473612.1 GtrA family protein [Armatimonadota bacterium]